MAKVEFEIEIEAPVEFVYQVSQDYSVRYDWDPFPERIALLHGASAIEKGVQVLVLARNGLKMVVEFVQVSPPSTAAIKMVSGPFFIQNFSGSWIFKANSRGSTNAKFVYVIKAKKWALPWITNYFATLYFSKIIKARLLGLKRYCQEHR